MFNYLFVNVVGIHIFVTYIAITSANPSTEELKQQYLGMVMDCAKQYPVSAAEMEQLRNKRMPDSEAARCLFACAYKKAGMMDAQGKLSVEGVHEISDKYFSDNPDKKQKVREFTDACKYVNDMDVSDGERGCDRANLIYKCSAEKAPQFDLIP